MLATLTGSLVIAGAIVVVVLLNAVFAFVQERHAVRALEALAVYLPHDATVVRDGRRARIDVRLLVPGDLVVFSEGDRVSADARLLEGELDLDESALTGESLPVRRAAGEGEPLVFSGTACVAGSARGVVTATGMHTRLGRIAALTQRVTGEESPLERQVRRIAWLIAAVAVGAGLVFLVIGVVAARLSFGDAAVFSIGLIVANVPEGLLPTITLALAVGVRALAQRGALVKRLSAVETLGSTAVICTDKTGTLTRNRMEVVEWWARDEAALRLAAAACTDADPLTGTGDPMELALLRWASVNLPERVHDYPFDTRRQLMSTLDRDADGLVLHVKGAPEAILARAAASADGIEERVGELAGRGLRVLAVAERRLDAVPADRDDAERDLRPLGLVAFLDPPRDEVPDAVRLCHEAGIRVIVVTGDHALTAANVARRVGIVPDAVIEGARVDAMSDDELGRLLARTRELVFARASPETKLRIADLLRHQGQVVAMTGDGVNDAPALRRADIGVAMGVSGTDVAREAATMVLTDDNFATIVSAVEEGRRVFANVRKFVFYIFVHLTPELVPFLVFALSGGLVPLPLLVQQILAIDLGTETLPALALAREPNEPGVMQRPPRSSREGVIRRPMLVRAWLFLGVISAAIAMAAYFAVLLAAGWSPGDDVGAGSPLHDAYRQATAATFLAIVVCQVGTAVAARTERASLRSIGVWSNPLLAWGILFELVFAAVVVAVPGIAGLFGAAVPPWWLVVALLPAPVLVWGADELARTLSRRSSRSTAGGA